MATRNPSTKRHLWLAALTAGVIGSVPQAGRAGQVQVTDNTTGGGTTIFNTTGAGSGVNRLLIGGTYGPEAFNMTTSSGNFSLSMSAIGWSNVGGVSFPGMFMLDVTDLTGVAGNLEVRVTQNFVVAPLFDVPGWTAIETLMGQFINTDGGPDGNVLKIQSAISGQPLTPLVAQDRFLYGPPFTLTATDTGINAPDQIVFTLMFQFSGTGLAGDQIAVPFTIQMAPTNVPVPEPTAWVLAVTAGLGGAFMLTLRLVRMRKPKRTAA